MGCRRLVERVTRAQDVHFSFDVVEEKVVKLLRCDRVDSVNLKDSRPHRTSNAHAARGNGGRGRGRAPARGGRGRIGGIKHPDRPRTRRPCRQPDEPTRRGSRQKSPAPKRGTPLSLAPGHRGGGAPLWRGLEAEGRGPPNDGSSGAGPPQRRRGLRHGPTRAEPSRP